MALPTLRIIAFILGSRPAALFLGKRKGPLEDRQVRGCLALPLLRRVPLFDAWPSPITFSCFFTITIGASALPRSAVGNLGPASRRETSPACRQRQALLSQAIVLGHLKIFAVPARATPAPWKH